MTGKGVMRVSDWIMKYTLQTPEVRLSKSHGREAETKCSIKNCMCASNCTTLAQQVDALRSYVALCN